MTKAMMMMAAVVLAGSTTLAAKTAPQKTSVNRGDVNISSSSASLVERPTLPCGRMSTAALGDKTAARSTASGSPAHPGSKAGID